MYNYVRIYKMLKDYGHSAVTAAQIVLDATRKDPHARQWIISVWRKRRG
jgi:hypothetical protein